MKTTVRYTSSGILLGLWLVIQPLLAADDIKPAKLFKDNSEWNVTLTGPWRTIRRNVKKDARYPAQLSYPGTDGQTYTLTVEVAPRGLTRRLRACKFPPLKVYFDKTSIKDSEFRGNRSLKLVTYCQTGSKYEQYYIKEFLAYRIYNLITALSFRVKPMVMNYQDSENKSKPITRFSFLIEDIDGVAKRNNLEKLTLGKIPIKQLDATESSYFALFQFMISNLDWAATSGPDANHCCHNSRPIGKSVDAIPKYVIPYDFDSSGLVNASYAAPPEGLKVRDVRQRLYRGFCTHNDKLANTVTVFNQKKPAIMALFEENNRLSSSSRDKALGYLEGFYQIINDAKRFKREIIDKCRG